MNLTKIKSFIFEGKTDKIDVNYIFQILEDIVFELEFKIDGLEIVKALSKKKENLYLLKVAFSKKSVFLNIFFDVSFFESDNMIKIKIRSSIPEQSLKSDETYIHFESIEDLKKQALDFILPIVKKHEKIELYRNEKHNFEFQFEQIYEEIFKKHGYETYFLQKNPLDLVNQNDGSVFTIKAVDSKNRDYIFNIMFYPNDSFRINLKTPFINREIPSKLIYIKNFKYNFKEAFEWALGDLKMKYKFSKKIRDPGEL